MASTNQLSSNSNAPSSPSCMDDFVMIEDTDHMSLDDHDDDDDDSYDYCEDAYSLVTTEQSDDDASVTMELPDVQEDVILNVPSVLLKDLDEAHAAAKLCRGGEHRSIASSVVSVTPDSMEIEQPEPSSSAGKKKGSKSSTATRMEDAKPHATGSTSRTSNKKRRKQLKLMKKAKAAAAAARQLEEKARAATATVSKPSESSSKASTMKKNKAPGARSSKKVANIAVACATETLASYRQELLKSKQTKA